jgi:hypothetical protein
MYPSKERLLGLDIVDNGGDGEVICIIWVSGIQDLEHGVLVHSASHLHFVVGEKAHHRTSEAMTGTASN